MPVAKPSALVNLLLARLQCKTRKIVLKSCETVELEFGNVVCDRDEPYRCVHFPLTGFLSQVSLVTGHPPLEICLIGNEGMLGGMLALGVQNVPNRVVVQGPGTALRMSADRFRNALQDHVGLLGIINRYNYTIFEQLTQTAACNRFHEVEARLAHRLLMIHDRAHNDHFRLTHRFLADMLGVLRSAVTIAASALQQRGLIHYSRGNISIIDRIGLETRACECYAIRHGDFNKLIV